MYTRYINNMSPKKKQRDEGDVQPRTGARPHLFGIDFERRLEFAVAVRSDWHGRGVGQLLMARLIEVAQQSGISELVGLVLHENKPMLKMCQSLASALRRAERRDRAPGSNRWLPCSRVRLLSESPFAKNDHDE